jgi:PAS domain S-box-containing protein
MTVQNLPFQNSFENLPEWMLQKWQGIADLLAELLPVRAALIMKTENEFMEVFLSSHSDGNPYHVGDKEKWYGLYCETVIKTQNKLRIPNALKDEHWKNNPDIKLGMVAYLGFPINFPNNQPFGTLCVLDNKEREFSSQEEKLLLQFKNVIELDLAMAQSFELKTNAQAETIKDWIRISQGLYAISEFVSGANSSLKDSLQSIVNLILTCCQRPDATCIRISCDGLEIATPNFRDSTIRQSVDIFASREIAGKIEICYLGEFAGPDAESVFLSDRKTFDDVARQVGVLIERKRAESALRAVAGEMNAIFSTQSDIILVYDIDQNVQRANPVFLEIYGFDPVGLSLQQVTTRVQCRLLDGQPLDLEKQPTPRALRGEKAASGIFRVVQANGQEAVVKTLSSPMYVDGRITGSVTVWHDITSLKKVESALNVSLEKYRVLFESFPLGITITNKDGKVLEANLQSERLLGISREEHQLRSSDSKEWKIIRPDGSPMPVDEFASVRAMKENRLVENIEMGIVKEKGDITWISVTAAPLPLDGYGAIVTYGDISARRETEEMLRVSEEKYRRIVETAYEGIWMIDSESKTTFVNHRMAEMLGYSVGEMLGASLFAFMDDEGKAIAAANVERRRKGIKEQHDFKFRCKDGAELWTIVETNPIMDKAGNFIGALAMVTDITERKRMENALQKSEASLMEAQRLAGMGSWEWDAKADHVTWSKGLYALALLDENLPAPTYAEHPRFYTEASMQRLNDAVQETIITGRPYELDLEMVRSDGSKKWLTARGEALYDDNHEFKGLRGTVLDVTERRQAEEKISQALAEKEMLLRELNHRTKNNLNIVSSLINIQADASDNEQFQALALTLDARIRSISLVHEMLYRAQSLSQINLAEYVHELVQNLASSFELSSSQVEVNVDAVPVLVGISSAIPCGQILNELISNAFKYAFPNGRQGRVDIQISQSRDGEISIRVADNGVGFPAGYNEAESKSLGVSLLHMLARQLNGRLTLETTHGVSCELRFAEAAGN